MKRTSGAVFINKRCLISRGMLLALLAVCIAGSRTTRQSVPKEAVSNTADTASPEKKYIKWVEFRVTREALQKAYEYDVSTHDSKHPLNWIELLSYLGAKYGGDFANYKAADMDALAEKLCNGKITMAQLTKDMKYYDYYYEAYSAVLKGMVGDYEIPDKAGAEMKPISENNSSASQNTASAWVKKYGLKAFHPIAKGFPYSDYDDFGVSRSYGYKRNHLGHDMMGQVGTPIVAVESGYVYNLGWNQYGGWRIGISSFDNKRYYYYAHLRQNFPYAKWLKEGSVVQAGDVIGYMGRTGYSAKENVNNIDCYHLHFGLQLIFDESQREGINQIWVDPYPIVQFLHQNQSETARNDATKEWSRTVPIRDPAVLEYEAAPPTPQIEKERRKAD